MKQGAMRSALAVQRRGCHGPWEWQPVTEKEKAKWGRFVPLPEDMPKMAHSFHNRKPGPSGKNYPTQSDVRHWGKEFRAWLKKANEEGRVLTRGDEKPIVRQPYQCQVAHKAYLEELKSMPLDEKLRLGHTVDEERSQPFHKVYGDDSFYQLKEVAVYLSVNTTAKQKKSDATDGVHLLRNGVLSDPYVESKYGTTFTEQVPDYIANLKEALAQREEAKKGQAKQDA
eukprot:TRINITY_DN65454_c0_g1_i1.p1 TRINITY_DN65454_c0_g1~~TRINITY_DN65454_c0_g1_i1.p1  ORF type:complete len:246 (+),score=71.30 TRINITY_DN65454_c0_g1_i1:59-739(+)